MALTSFIPPIVEILGISAAVALGTTLAYKYLTDQTVMKELKSQLKKLQEQTKQNKDNLDKLGELNKESMRINADYMKHSLKPMIVTMVPFILVFAWLKSVYGEAVIIPLGTTLPLIGNSLEWFGTYFIFSVVLTSLFRKLMKVA